MRTRLAVLATVLGLVVASSAHAGHHLWDFTEIFSNADGSVQYMELFTAEDNEQNLGPFTIASNVPPRVFSFVTSLSTTATANTWVLVATSNFAGQFGAVAPDYIIPGSFFPTGGGTLNYASGADVWNYGAVPLDGYHSLLRNGTIAINSPTNFAGQTGSVRLGPALPMVPTWGLVLLVGAMLLAASGLIRKRGASTA